VVAFSHKSGLKPVNGFGMFGDRIQLFRLVDLVHGTSGHVVGSGGGMAGRRFQTMS